MSTDRYLIIVTLEGADYFAVNVDGPEEYKVHVDGENYFFTGITDAVEKFLEKYEDDLGHDEIFEEFIYATGTIEKVLSGETLPDCMYVSRSA